MIWLSKLPWRRLDLPSSLVLLQHSFLEPPLNDPMTHKYHETLSVSQRQILQTSITTISSSSKPTSTVLAPATSPLTPRENMYRCIYLLCLVLVG